MNKFAKQVVLSRFYYVMYTNDYFDCIQTANFFYGYIVVMVYYNVHSANIYAC